MSLRNKEINNLFKLSGWGGFPVIDAFKRKPSSLGELREFLQDGAAIPEGMEDHMVIAQLVKKIQLT